MAGILTAQGKDTEAIKHAARAQQIDPQKSSELFEEAAKQHFRDEKN